MCKRNWSIRVAGWIALALGLAYAPRAMANGGPFLIKYPNGDPAAKGVLARIDPDLKPAREERLRVVKENLNVLFLPAQQARFGVVVPTPNQPAAPPAVLGENPPLAVVSALYTIENPTDELLEIEFGFPILRGVYVRPWGMTASPDAQVKFGNQEIRPDVISNSMIYGLIRQRAQEVIDKVLATDPELGALVARVKTCGYVRQRAREAVQRVAAGQETVLKAVQSDPMLSKLLAAGCDAADPDRTKARQALQDYLTGRLHWDKPRAALMVEYASMELGAPASHPADAGNGYFWGNLGEMGRFAYANMGRLSAIGEQKSTQLFAELAAHFEPKVKHAYEAVFAAWGGDVRERSVDLRTGQVRPRELALDSSASRDGITRAAALDPTIYARMEYIDPNANLTAGEKASCEAIIKNLPVTFTFAPMNLLHYKVNFPAHSTQMLEVRYKQYAYVDTHEPATYQLAYVVHPASLWKTFGPIELEIALPEGVEMRASVACRQMGVGEREIPKELPGPKPEPNKMRVAVHRGVVKDKTGELFLAVDAKQWNTKTEVNRTVPAIPTKAAQAKY